MHMHTLYFFNIEYSLPPPGFNMREALSDVKAIMDVRMTGGGAVSWEERCHGLHRHYQSLFREHKKQERKLVECQKKQLEVSLNFVGKLM